MRHCLFILLYTTLNNYQLRTAAWFEVCSEWSFLIILTTMTIKSTLSVNKLNLLKFSIASSSLCCGRGVVIVACSSFWWFVSSQSMVVSYWLQCQHQCPQAHLLRFAGANSGLTSQSWLRSNSSPTNRPSSLHKTSLKVSTFSSIALLWDCVEIPALQKQFWKVLSLISSQDFFKISTKL